jgi:predicted AAA+ superfamily ATPase
MSTTLQASSHRSDLEASMYIRRVVDDELDELLSGVSAVALEGPKAVGKTATALERAASVYRLDDPRQQQLVEADPARLISTQKPVLIDEWQRVPSSWDIVRRAVDQNPEANRFLLTGSANPDSPSTHSGAGRIVRVRMRPMSLVERGVDSPSVSLGDLLSGERPSVDGQSQVGIATYTDEILRSGFPAMRELSGRALRAQLESYLSRVVDKDFLEFGYVVRDPDLLLRWMRSYAAASSTTATLETIRDGATAGESIKPTRDSVLAYRSALSRLWLLDPVPAWLPSRNQISRLTRPDKHQLTDPALCGSLLGVTAAALLTGDDAGIPFPRDGTLLGSLFESLVTQSVRVYAQANEAEVRHLRTKNGRHEVDLVVVRPDQRVVAIEVKLAGTVTDSDVRHLTWLRDVIGQDLLDAVVVYSGPYAYRRPDGIAVVPASLLGP